MKVYVVVLETEENTQVLDAFKDKKAAVDYVRQEYDKTVSVCQLTGLIEGETTDLPDECGATIYYDPNDFWVWSIDECELVE